MISIPKALHSRGVLLLILTTIIWGTSFPLLKTTLESLPPAVILASRFVVAAIAFAPWLRKLDRALIRDGVLLAGVYFAECAFALIGLQSISANRSAFIVSLNVILVPLLATLIGRQLPLRVLLAAGLAIMGIGIMSWEGGGFSVGDALTLGCAVGIAIYMLMLEVITPRHPTLPLVAIQLLVMALLGTLWALPQLVDQLDAIANHFNTFLYLGLIVTATPIWTQALAQRWVTAHEAALFYTLEPVFATVFSFWLLGEELGIRGAIGSAIILAATFLSQRRRPVSEVQTSSEICSRIHGD